MKVKLRVSNENLVFYIFAFILLVLFYDFTSAIKIAISLITVWNISDSVANLLFSERKLNYSSKNSFLQILRIGINIIVNFILFDYKTNIYIFSFSFFIVLIGLFIGRLNDN